MRILLAEDEAQLNRVILAALEHDGYQVDSVFNGQEALNLANQNTYNVIILHIMMPIMTGLEALKEIRATGNTTHVIMLTAMAEVDDRVTGLDAGADDYLTKPFQTAELLARLRALGRRSSSFQENVLRFGDLSLDTTTAILTCETSGQNVRLSEKELRILEYMIGNHGHIMTRDQLAIKIWGFESDAEYNNVEVYMSFTRKKLAFIGSTVEIKAVRGLGYELRD